MPRRPPPAIPSAHTSSTIPSCAHKPAIPVAHTKLDRHPHRHASWLARQELLDHIRNRRRIEQTVMRRPRDDRKLIRGPL